MTIKKRQKLLSQATEGLNIGGLIKLLAGWLLRRDYGSYFIAEQVLVTMCGLRRRACLTYLDDKLIQETPGYLKAHITYNRRLKRLQKLVASWDKKEVKK